MRNQRKQNEVRDLLEKIPYDMIINNSEPRSKKIIEQERKEGVKKREEKIISKQKKKTSKDTSKLAEDFDQSCI